MGARTEIEWAESTWSPVTGCTKLSAGCDHCYAESIAHRFSGTKAWPNGFDVTLHPERLGIPLRWRRPRRIFVCSTGDLFHDQVPDDYIAQVWQAMGCAPQHTYQVLTKRHARMRSWVTRWYAGEIEEPHEVRDVPGYPGYRISTTGTVFGKRSDTADGLSFGFGELGHQRVTMHREGSPRSGNRELVHRLVLTTFVRPGLSGEQACHRNGDPSDNRLSNLYWGSQSDNWRDRIGHGNGRSWSKLTDADVGVIRQRAGAGESAYRIAQDYPVSDTQIRNVLRGNQWATPTDVQRINPLARTLLDCVWLGVSTENQQWADIRIPALLDTPAAVRWISAEPLLGPINLTRLTPARVGGPLRSNALAPVLDRDRGVELVPSLDWVVVGGESGSGARPMHPTWALDLLEACRAAEVPFLFKQWGAWSPRATALGGDFTWCGRDGTLCPDEWNARNGSVAMWRVGRKRAGRELCGRTWDEYPKAVTAC